MACTLLLLCLINAHRLKEEWANFPNRAHLSKGPSFEYIIGSSSYLPIFRLPIFLGCHGTFFLSSWTSRCVSGWSRGELCSWNENESITTITIIIIVALIAIFVVIITIATITTHISSPIITITRTFNLVENGHSGAYMFGC